MKQPKKMTRTQKIAVSKAGLDATQYSLVSEDVTSFIIVLKTDFKVQKKVTYKGKLIE